MIAMDSSRDESKVSTSPATSIRAELASWGTFAAGVGVVVILLTWWQGLPDPLPEDAPPDRFSAERAMRVVRHLTDDIGMRPNGSQAQEPAAEYLAGREEPLHSNVEAGAAPKKPQASRKVSLGTMPDFAFPGPGVRVARVMEGSAAEAAALEAGDVILAVDGEEISDLRSYSKLLKACAPGQTIRLRVRRGGEEIHVPATLRAR